MKKMLLGFVLLCGMSAGAFAQDDFATEQGFSPGLEPASPPQQSYLGLTGGYGIPITSCEIANPFLKDLGRVFKKCV